MSDRPQEMRAVSGARPVYRDRANDVAYWFQDREWTMNDKVCISRLDEIQQEFDLFFRRHELGLTSMTTTREMFLIARKGATASSFHRRSSMPRRPVLKS